jgi:Ras family protein
MSSPPPIQRKIALLGYPGVGKSSITLRIVQGIFPDGYDTTIEDHYTVDFKFQGKIFTLQLVDTAGQNEYSIFPRSCSVDVQGYVLVYSIDSEASFTVAKTIHDKILENVGGDHIPLVLVGNKSDLRHVERAVSVEEGKKQAGEWRAAFIETSAKENMQVDEIFRLLLTEIDKIDRQRGNFQEDSGNKKCTIS